MLMNFKISLAASAFSLLALVPAAQAQDAACGPNTSASACQKEAAAARAAARRGQLTSADNLQANALMRCDRLPEADRDTCRKRITQGQASGSVEGGGKLIELRETIVIKP